MREHVHSSHRKSFYKYTYNDNPQAKRVLQGMIDRALSSAIQQMVARRPSAAGHTTTTTAGGANAATLKQQRAQNGVADSNGPNAAKRQRLHDVLSRHISHETDGGDSRRPSSSVTPDEEMAVLSGGATR